MRNALLRKLRLDTNDVLKSLDPKHADFKNEPVNWASLRCIAAYQRFDEDGSSDFFVTIEEAAPDCRAFRDAIACALMEKGWTKIDVVTEW